MDDKLNEISEYKNSIARNAKRIRELEDDIKELQALKKKTQKMINTMEDVSNSVRIKVNNIMSGLRYPIKPDLFSGLLNHVNGTAYRDSTSSLYEGIKKAQLKIDEYRSEINRLRQKNNNYSIQIQTLENSKEE